MFENVKWRIASGVSKRHVIRNAIEHNKMANFINGNLDSVYDSFLGMIWNSGRVAPGANVDLRVIREIIADYDNQGVKFSLVCSNNLLQPKHIKDQYENQILEILNEYHGNVIISSDLMYNHVKKHFKNLKTIHSCIPNKSDLVYLKEKQDQYDIVVLPPKSNWDFDLISQLNTPKLEILINEYCLRNCAVREKHYISLSQTALDGDSFNDYKEKNCPRRNTPYQICVEKSCLLDYNEVVYLYDQLGITNFKIQGRAAPDEFFIFDFVKYLCRQDMTSFIFRELFSMTQNVRMQMQNTEQNNMAGMQQKDRILNQGGFTRR